MTSDQGLDFFGEHHILANFPLNRKIKSVLVCGFVAVVSNRLHWLTGLGPNVDTRLSCSFHLKTLIDPLLPSTLIDPLFRRAGIFCSSFLLLPTFQFLPVVAS
jgi:hypothetical protein